MLTRNGFGAEVAAMRKAGAEHRPMPFQTNPELMEAMGDKMLEENPMLGDLERVAMGIEERRTTMTCPLWACPGHAGTGRAHPRDARS